MVCQSCSWTWFGAQSQFVDVTPFYRSIAICMIKTHLAPDNHLQRHCGCCRTPTAMTPRPTPRSFHLFMHIYPAYGGLPSLRQCVSSSQPIVRVAGLQRAPRRKTIVESERGEEGWCQYRLRRKTMKSPLPSRQAACESCRAHT